MNASDAVIKWLCWLHVTTIMALKFSDSLNDFSEYSQSKVWEILIITNICMVRIKLDLAVHFVQGVSASWISRLCLILQLDHGQLQMQNRKSCHIFDLNIPTFPLRDLTLVVGLEFLFYFLFFFLFSAKRKSQQFSHWWPANLSVVLWFLCW